MNRTDDLNDTYVKVLREMSGERRLKISFELFDMVLQLTTAGIRSQYPTFTEEQIASELRKRIVALSGETASSHH